MFNIPSTLNDEMLYHSSFVVGIFLDVRCPAKTLGNFCRCFMCSVKPHGRGIPKISDPWDRRPSAGYFGNALAWTALAGVKTAAGRYQMDTLQVSQFLRNKIFVLDWISPDTPPGISVIDVFWKTTMLAPKTKSRSSQQRSYYTW